MIIGFYRIRKKERFNSNKSIESIEKYIFNIGKLKDTFLVWKAQNSRSELNIGVYEPGGKVKSDGNSFGGVDRVGTEKRRERENEKVER